MAYHYFSLHCNTLLRALQGGGRGRRDRQGQIVAPQASSRYKERRVTYKDIKARALNKREDEDEGCQGKENLTG